MSVYSTNFTITWTGPQNCLSYNGPGPYFNVRYSLTSSSGIVIEMRNVSIEKDRMFTATSLAPRTRYQVSVSLRNQMGSAHTYGSNTVTTFGKPGK